MLRMVLGQVVRRRGRTMAVITAIVVASVSFSLLTSAVATSRLEVRGTVEANFRTAYDILVRPAGSTTPLERSNGLVQENYLSGIFGGITMDQYHAIEQIRGVEVAAPVAMVGYLLPSLFPPINVTDLLSSSDSQQLFRVKRTWITDRGLSRIPDFNKYVYATTEPFTAGGKQRDPVTGRKIPVCGEVPPPETDPRLNTPTSPFDLQDQTELTCYSTTSVHGDIGTGYQYPVPLLLAAIDPVQEAKLVGLDQAVVSGRYLTPADHTQQVPVRPGEPATLNRVPVLMADRPLSDETLKITVQRLHIGDPNRLPGRLAGKHAYDWVDSLPGTTVRTTVLPGVTMYRRLVHAYARPAYNAKTQYWSAGQLRYTTGSGGHLTPVQQHNPVDTWIEPLYQFNGGWFAPQENADVGFRRLHVHVGSNQIGDDNFRATPILHQVGVFDPDLIAGFSQLSQVPLTTYYPPSAAPGDARSKELLAGRPLLPNANLAGYLQQPPMMLTTLRSLPTMTDTKAFYGARSTKKAPISVIRVRVAGVTGADALSRERVRLVAEQIVRQTGLDVDVTIGSSPTPQLIDLPAGNFGRPALTLQEGWVKKDAAVRLLSAIDTKSLALFGLVLLVCLLFLLNATIAAVRSRRTELGVLACLGWPARRIFALLQVELLATGLVAGLLGSAIATALTTILALHIAWWQLALITPVATVLACLAGLGPAYQACRTRPLEAITPAVRAPRHARHVGSISKLALVGLTRWPGRTVLGAASLFIGVTALAILIAIQTAFQGRAVGTLLGDAVAVQVRGVDYLAAALTIALGAFAVADIAYLNISERTAEIGTYRACGWTEGHVRRLFGTEALATAGLGAGLGAATGVAIVAVAFPIAWQTVTLAAAAAAGAGVLAALAALTLPLSRLSRLAPATAISLE